MSAWRERMMEMLKFITEENASDLHLSVGIRPYIRVNGTIRSTEFPELTQEDCENLLFSLLTEDERNAYNEYRTLDFSFGEPGVGRFRVNIYQQRGTIAAAIRLLPFDIRSLEVLGLPPEPVRNFCGLSHGLILICGPVGSGKTTTLASMIDHINRTRSCHIMSIEDPIEYVHHNVKSLIHQREIRRDTPNFGDALKYILREDPDIVVIGEMRDLETILSAVTIAETGHLVFATLHTGDASESIRRIIDVFPAKDQSQIVAQLSYTLMGVINQLLLPRADGHGRVLASEVLTVTPAIQNLIRENKIEQVYTHIQIGTSFGMQTMNQSLAGLVKAGIITAEAAVGETKRVKELTKLLENGNG